MNFHSAYKGIVKDLAEPDYRSDPALSTSDLKLMGDTPKAFYARRKKLHAEKRTQAMELGILFHLYALERNAWDEQVVVCPDEYTDRRKGESKKWWARFDGTKTKIIRETELQAIKSMHAAYVELPGVKEALLRGPQSEVSAFFRGLVEGVDVKCRVDILAGDTVVDIKTTAKGGSTPRAFLRKCRELRYDWQQSNYTRILSKCGVEVKRWIWAVVETSPPYDCAAYELAEADVAAADEEVVEAYRKLRSCIKLDSWPSHTPTQPLTLSRFGTNR